MCGRDPEVRVVVGNPGGSEWVRRLCELYGVTIEQGDSETLPQVVGVKDSSKPPKFEIDWMRLTSKDGK